MYRRLFFTLLLLFFGCGGSDPQPTNDTGNASNDVVAPDLGPAPSDTEPVQDLITLVDQVTVDDSGPMEDVPSTGLSFVGTWAQIQHSETVTDSPLGGDTINTTIHTLHLVEVTEEADGTLKAHHSICDIQAESDFIQTETIIPAAYINALEPYSRSVDFNWSTKEFTAERVTEVKGCILDDPENDDLPTSDSDPRVIDQDGDGHPGMTIQISGLINGDLYVVERNWTLLEGTIVNDTRVEGLLSWGVEQNKLGTSNVLLSMDISSWVDPDPNKSSFEMIRANDGADCAALSAEFGQLF
jgi:hypothetical protein